MLDKPPRLLPPGTLHPLHRLWRLLPVTLRRQAYVSAVATLAPKPDRHPPPPPPHGGVAVAGELETASGLGHGARLMLRALDIMGVPTYPVDTGSLMPGGRASPTYLPAGIPLVVHVNSPAMAAALLRFPRSLVRNRRIIGYWAWELPRAPANWQRGVPFVHEIWAPSTFTAGALERLLPNRVRVVPHPLAVVPPVPSGLGRSDFGLPDNAVAVLVSFNCASSMERKNPLAAIQAFKAAFGDRPDRILILKIINPDHFPDDFARVRTAVGSASNIRIDTRIMTMADNHALMRASDIILSLHRSEGFGFVPAEAMLLDRPVISTGWSGNMDYMDPDSVALVPCQFVQPADPRKIFDDPGSVWAEPDQAAAIAALRRLADDPALRIALGRRGRDAARARLGAQGLRDALLALGLAVGQGVEATVG